MGSILGFDPAAIKTVTEKRLGSQAAARAWKDLGVILTHLSAHPGERVPVTAEADEALHDLLLDTPAHLALSAAVAGPGAILSHDPNAYGTPAFAEAWGNTRAAFAAQGVDLPADYRVGGAAACWILIHRMAA